MGCCRRCGRTVVADLRATPVAHRRRKSGGRLGGAVEKRLASRGSEGAMSHGRPAASAAQTTELAIRRSVVAGIGARTGWRAGQRTRRIRQTAEVAGAAETTRPQRKLIRGNRVWPARGAGARDGIGGPSRERCRAASTGLSQVRDGRAAFAQARRDARAARRRAAEALVEAAQRVAAADGAEPRESTACLASMVCGGAPLADAGLTYREAGKHVASCRGGLRVSLAFTHVADDRLLMRGFDVGQGPAARGNFDPARSPRLEAAFAPRLPRGAHVGKAFSA